MKQKTILLELLRWLCAGLAVVFLVVSFRQEPVSSAAFGWNWRKVRVAVRT